MFVREDLTIAIVPPKARSRFKTEITGSAVLVATRMAGDWYALGCGR